MPRFFIDNLEKQKGDYINVDGENARHIASSLRMSPGERLTVCNNAGFDYLCVIESVGGKDVLLLVEEVHPSDTEPETEISIYQCIPKSDKLELIVQKCTELGVVEFVPVRSSRCISKIDEGKKSKKISRLEKIALEAAKQSRRGKVPRVAEPMGFEAALERAGRVGDVFLLYEGGGKGLGELLDESGRKINVFVGPEGGFSDEEVALASEKGARIVGLGKRILRTETAPIAVSAAIMFHRGEWR